MANKQKGFALIGILAIAIVLAAVAGVGYYVWYKHHKPLKPYSPVVSSSTVSTTTSTSGKVTEDLTKLPLGDGNVTTTTPQANYVYSCTNNFKGGGAEHAGSWISGNTWNAKTKPTVDGSVSWPSAKVDISIQGASRIISGNGLPVGTPTGIFPIQKGTTAYQYDTNPNSIKSYNVYVSLPDNPTVASAPGCLPLGPIGYMTNGVALFDALDDAGRDAAAHEIQDKCDGHPQKEGIYHYHSLSSCIDATAGNNQLLGYALDGFGIYSDKDASGNVITNGQLDICHGLTSEITWDGKQVNMYHYVLNNEYPYSLGCFRGVPVQTH